MVAYCEEQSRWSGPRGLKAAVRCQLEGAARSEEHPSYTPRIEERMGLKVEKKNERKLKPNEETRRRHTAARGHDHRLTYTRNRSLPQVAMGRSKATAAEKER